MSQHLEDKVKNKLGIGPYNVFLNHFGYNEEKLIEIAKQISDRLAGKVRAMIRNKTYDNDWRSLLRHFLREWLQMFASTNDTEKELCPRRLVEILKHPDIQLCSLAQDIDKADLDGEDCNEKEEEETERKRLDRELKEKEHIAVALAKAQDEENKKNVEYQLVTKFNDVFVNKESLQTARTLMENMPMDRWNENTHYNVYREVSQDGLEAFLNLLSEALQLPKDKDNELRAKIKMIQMTKSIADSPMTVKYEISEFVSIYGFLFAIQEDGERFSVAYAIHKLEFKIADTNQRLTPSQIEAIKQTYSMHKALETLRNLGVVKQINYIEDQNNNNHSNPQKSTKT